MTTTQPASPTETTGLPGADFDHRDHESIHDPWGRWATLRASDSLGRSGKHGGFYIASRYADVCAVARNAAAFSSHPGVSIPEMVSPPFPPINFDPPVNRIYREIVNPYFSPAKVQEYEPWIREITERYTKRLLGSSRFDFTKDLAMPLTREVILRIMGISSAPEEVNEWSDDLIMQSPNAANAAGQLMGFLGAELQGQRDNPGGDNMLAGLAVAAFEDRPLEDGEILAMALLLLLAGLETTASAMSGATWYLVQHPEVLTEFVELATVADTKKWNLAMDEFVRWSSPATANSRNVRADVEVHGCPMSEGDKVLMIWASANRDESEFPGADAMDLQRHPNRHVGFGMGPHRCLGSHLAKLVMRSVFEAIAADLPSWRLEDPASVTWEGGEVRGIRSLVLVRD